MSDETRPGSHTRDEKKAVGLWERTKAWADKNRTISGALVGGAAGTIVPGAGPLIGRARGRRNWICLIAGEERRGRASTKPPRNGAWSSG
jgi:hypothetical protein